MGEQLTDEQLHYFEAWKKEKADSAKRLELLRRCRDALTDVNFQFDGLALDDLLEELAEELGDD